MINEKAITILQAIKVGTAEAYISDEAIESAIDLAISALEKQVPMKPLPQEMDIDGRAITPCRFCGEGLPKNVLYDFCPFCGQAIDRRKE